MLTAVSTLLVNMNNPIDGHDGLEGCVQKGAVNQPVSSSSLCRLGINRLFSPRERHLPSKSNLTEFYRREDKYRGLIFAILIVSILYFAPLAITGALTRFDKKNSTRGYPINRQTT
jgi:hypothetical protein